MENIINEAHIASKNLHCETPKIIALFCLLPQYFLEKETEVFHFLLIRALKYLNEYLIIYCILIYTK